MNNKRKPVPSQLLDLLDNDTDKERFKEYYYSELGRFLRKLLVEYLNKEISRSVINSDNNATFDKPAWAEYQAKGVGERQRLRDIIQLLDR